MFDIGWLELLVIGIVALIVVGPKDLPGMFRTVGRFMGKMRGMAREFQRSMEAAADETGLKEAAKSLNDVGNIAKDPLAQARKSATDYASSYVTQKDQKAADTKADPGSAETASAEAPAAKATDKAAS